MAGFALRLRALATDPDAFLTTVEEQTAEGLEWFEYRLRDSERDLAYCMIAAFVEDAMVGIVGMMRAR